MKLSLFFRRLAGILRHPSATFQVISKESLPSSFGYVAWLLALNGLIGVIGGIVTLKLILLSILGNHQALGWISVFITFPAILVAGFFLYFVTGLILHGLLRLFGSRTHLFLSLKVVAYGNTPLLLSLWFPPILFVTIIWSFLLMVKGLHQQLRLAPWRAALALLMPWIIICVIFLPIRWWG